MLKLNNFHSTAYIYLFSVLLSGRSMGNQTSRYGGSTDFQKRLGRQEVFGFTEEVGELMHADPSRECECDRSKLAEFYRETFSRRLVVTVCHGCDNLVSAQVV